MAKLLRNLYWESEIDSLLEQEKSKLNFKTKSQLLRIILKQRYGLCLDENCLAYSLGQGFCQLHNDY